MANVAQTKQQQFKTTALIKMDSLKAIGLKTYADKAIAKGGESYSWYLKKKATAQEGVPTMYGASHSQLGGDFEKITAMIERISSQEKLNEEDMLKTRLDLKSPLIITMTNAVLQKEDEKIITKISQASGLKEAGSATKKIDSEDIIKELIQVVRSSHVWSKLGLEKKKGVALVMNEADYSELASSKIFIHADYADAFRGGTGDIPLNFYGAEIVISEAAIKGTLYVIPSGTFGFAEWESSTITDCEFHSTDARRWHLQIIKSLGVAVLEPTKITKFSVKP